MRDSFEEIKGDLKEILFRSQGTVEVEKKFESLLSILELLKLMARQKQPKLPIEIEVEGKQKTIKNREELIQFIRNLQSWLLRAGDLLEKEDLASIIIRARLLTLQLVYSIGFYEHEELVKIDYARPKINSRETDTSPY